MGLQPARTSSGTSHRGRDGSARWGLFLFALALTVARTPDLFLTPRLWAEEGALFLQHAYAHRWHETLFDTPLGYYCFLSSLAATLGAGVVPVEWVAHFTTGFALLIQLVPVALIVWGRSPVWRGLAERFLGVCILLLNPFAEEIWLTTTNLHFYGSTIAFLVLLEDPASETPGRRWAHRALLVVAGLSGPPACLLAPLFAIEALRGGRREEWVRAALLATLTLFQLALVVAAAGDAPAHPHYRFAPVRVSELAPAILVRAIVVPFLGRDLGESCGQLIVRLRAVGYDTHGLLTLACAVVLGGALFLVARRATPRQRWRYTSAFVLLVVSPFYLGIGDRAGWVRVLPGARYFYAPTVVLLLFLLAQLDLRAAADRSRRAPFVAVLLALALVVQAGELRRRAFDDPRGPRWREEVARWRTDPSHRLRIWPKGWELSIPSPVTGRRPEDQPTASQTRATTGASTTAEEATARRQQPA